MLPARSRPCGSQRPSLKRWCAGSYGAAATLRSSVPSRLREPDAAAQRDDEAAGAAQREAADRLRHRHHGVVAGRGIEAVERRRVDVDPVQHLLGGRPDRAFAEARLDVEHAAKRRRAAGCRRTVMGALATKMRIVQENAAPAASIRVPVPASPRAARLKASVMCVTGSTATKSRPAGAYTTRKPAARSAAIVDVERPGRVGERRRAVPAGEDVVDACRRGARRANPRRHAARNGDAADRQLRGVVLPDGRGVEMRASVVAVRGKNGWKPRPNGNGASPVLAMRELRASASRRRASAASANALRRAERPRPGARVGAARPRARAPAARSSRRARRRAMARCQPTPWIACGWSPKLRASAMVAAAEREARVARCGSNRGRADSTRGARTSPAARASAASGAGRRRRRT